MMSTEAENVEQEVQARLSAIRGIPGGWETMLDILWRRGLVGRLRGLRIQQGITKAQCAEFMGVTVERIEEIENALFPNPYIATLARYARALGAELELSVYEKPDLAEPDAQPPEQHEDDEQQYGVPV